MVLVNVIAYERYCTVSFPYKSRCFANKNRKSVKCDQTFIFIELSETFNSFVKIRLVLEIKSTASFIKTHLYSKRGCIKMRKHAVNVRC